MSTLIRKRKNFTAVSEPIEPLIDERGNRSPVSVSSRARSYPRTRDEDKEYQRALEIQQREAELEHLIALNLQYQQKNYEEQEDTFEELNETRCLHKETEVVNGVVECVDCGEHLDEVVDQEQEWRYYGSSDNKNMSDPSRCQARKIPERGIREDLKRLHLPTHIINLADQYYHEVTQGDIKRGKLRKGIMYACVYEAYKDSNKVQLPDELRKKFGIDKKNGSRGLTYFLGRRKNRSNRQYITAEHFIPKICEKFDLLPEVVEEVLELYQQVKNKSHKLDHSYPQSVSCGCVFYLMKRKNIEITPEQFGKIVDLSSITVLKKANEIEEILNN